MAIPSTVNAQQFTGNVIGKLLALRQALLAVEDLYAWAVTVSAADLEALGMSAADANLFLSALADANALYQYYNTGLPPGSYPQPASTYVYGTSQRTVIGPQ